MHSKLGDSYNVSFLFKYNATLENIIVGSTDFKHTFTNDDITMILDGANNFLDECVNFVTDVKGILDITKNINVAILSILSSFQLPDFHDRS